MKKITLFLALILTAIIAPAQNVITTNNTGQYGVVDVNGNWIIPARFKFIDQDANTKLYSCYEQTVGSNTCGIYSETGQQLTPHLFAGYTGYESDRINNDSNPGRIRYLSVMHYENGNTTDVRASIYDIDNQKLLLPWKYQSVNYYGGYFSARPDNHKTRFDYYDINGNLLLADVDVAIAMKNGAGKEYICFDKDKMKGVYDVAQHRIIFQPRDVALVAVTNDDAYFEVQLQQKPVLRRTYYDKATCKEIIPMKKYESADHLGDGLFRVYRNGKVGLYAKGKEIVECTFDRISSFEGGVAQFEKNGEVRLIKNPLLGDSGPEIQQLIADAANKRIAGAPAVSRYPAAESDVDLEIPKCSKVNENLFAFIIANENYPDAPVPFALNDGRAFRKYCETTLGVPAANITMLEDATYGSIIGAVEKLKKVADAYDGEASVMVYYAGHGFPDEKQQSAYLLPIDGNGSDITATGFSLAEFYKVLGTIKLKSAVVFLDACFSGTKREDEMLAESRGVSIKVKEEKPGGNLVVFTASQGDETAHQMEENRHGLFTYFLLKGFKEQGATTSLGELADYVTKQVRRQSVVINDKRQTPTVIPSPAVETTWRDLHIAH